MLPIRNGGSIARPSRNWYMCGNAGFFVDGLAHVQMSNDGISFNNRSTGNGDYGTYSTFSNPDAIEAAGDMGCPLLVNYAGKLLMFGSEGITTTGWTACYFTLATCTDGNTFTKLVKIDFTSFFGASTHPQTWPTSAFIDQSNVLHVIFEYSPNSNLSGDSLIYHLYETHDTSGGALTSWSTPVQITGTGTTGYIGLQSGNSQLDGFIVTDDFATYYLFFKNDLSTKKCIEVATASSLTGPYTTSFKIDDWAGWSFGNSTPMEAPRRLIMPDRNRMYLDQQGNGIYYSDNFAGNSVAAMFSLSEGWSTPKLITYSSGDFASGHAQHISIVPNLYG